MVKARKKPMRWVAWFKQPKTFSTKKEMDKYCKGKIVITSKIQK
jgi:hypothetical protein